MPALITSSLLSYSWHGIIIILRKYKPGMLNIRETVPLKDACQKKKNRVNRCSTADHKTITTEHQYHGYPSSTTKCKGPKAHGSLSSFYDGFLNSKPGDDKMDSTKQRKGEKEKSQESIRLLIFSKNRFLFVFL